MAIPVSVRHRAGVDALNDTGDSIIRDAATRIFADLADPQTLNATEGAAWREPLWSALEESGLTRAWVSAQRGGAGVSIADGFEILRAAGQFAVPVPLAETMLAGLYLDAVGIDCPSGPLAVAPMRLGDQITIDAEGTVTGTARAVPHLPGARGVVVVAEREIATDPGSIARFGAQEEDGQMVALLSAQTINSVGRSADMGGERADITFENVFPVEAAPVPDHWVSDTPMLIGAAVRAVQMTGALETVLHLTGEYAAERVAFGRPIAKFQAVQHNMARLAGEVAAALAASGSAADTLARQREFDQAMLLEIAAAKIRVGEAANEGAAIAHQIHGAIGWTAEHTLQWFTRRLWGWRDDFGTESHWAVMLGDMAAAEGADALWPMLAAR